MDSKWNYEHFHHKYGIAYLNEHPFDIVARIAFADELEERGFASAARRQRAYIQLLDKRDKKQDYCFTPIICRLFVAKFYVGKRFYFILNTQKIVDKLPRGRKSITPPSPEKIARRRQHRRRQVTYAVNQYMQRRNDESRMDYEEEMALYSERQRNRRRSPRLRGGLSV